jgi:hypothetical protein
VGIYRRYSLQKSNLFFINLFAGCGELSLGPEQAGFEPLLFSEINRDATLNEDNSSRAKRGKIA